MIMKLKKDDKKKIMIGVVFIFLVGLVFLLGNALMTAGSQQGSFRFDDYQMEVGDVVDIESEITGRWPDSNSYLENEDDYEGMTFEIRELNTDYPSEGRLHISYWANNGGASKVPRSIVIDYDMTEFCGLEEDVYTIVRNGKTTVYMVVTCLGFRNEEVRDVTVELRMLEGSVLLYEEDEEPEPECENDDDCDDDEVCDDGECESLDCILGEHPEDHECVVDEPGPVGGDEDEDEDEDEDDEDEEEERVFECSVASDCMVAGMSFGPGEFPECVEGICYYPEPTPSEGILTYEAVSQYFADNPIIFGILIVVVAIIMGLGLFNLFGKRR